VESPPPLDHPGRRGHLAAGGALDDAIERQLDERAHHGDADVARLADAIERRHGPGVAAVLLYGSYLRGKRDTLLDFYVLVDELGTALPGRWHALGNRLLPPNVYYLSLPADGSRPALRAKYATMTLSQFERGMRRYQSYFWSRFTQPTGLVRVRDAAVRRRVIGAMAAAVDTFVRTVAPNLPETFTASELWSAGFARTYRCELRSERADAGPGLYAQQAEFFDALLAAYATTPDPAVAVDPAGYRRRVAARPGTLSWRLRALQGKTLSVLRLVKAAGTFDDPLDYLLWKIERHSGVYIAPTERQRRHPLIFAWPLLLRLYRRGAFR
jgi:hypothetical protein